MERVEIELHEQKATNMLLKDMIENNNHTIKNLYKIIIVLIVSFSLLIAAGFGTFAWYESQFEYETSQTTEVYSEGDNSNAEYINGNQYNDNAYHSEEADN